MERYLLDSSIILDMLEGNARGRRARERVENAEATTSIICYCEVLNKGTLAGFERAHSLLDKLPVFETTLADGHLAVEMQLACRRAGTHVRTADCLIAATAMNRGAVVLASDGDFLRIDGARKEIIE